MPAIRDYQRRKELGLCTECGKEKVNNFSKCEKCRTTSILQKRKLRSKRTTNKLCLCGQAPMPGTRQCEKCLSQKAAYNQKYRRLPSTLAKINERRTTDICFKLKGNIRNRLRRAIQGNYKAGSAVSDLGCCIESLKQHLESQFQSGMTWENYGQWHIDHIKPLASFDLTEREQFLEACNYTNLQPLWAAENIRKGDKIGQTQ